MNKRKKRTIWVLSILSIILLVGGGIAFQRQIREQYWIWKLEACPPSECDEVYQEIVTQRYFNSVPRLLMKIEEESKSYEDWGVGELSQIPVKDVEDLSGLSYLISEGQGTIGPLVNDPISSSKSLMTILFPLPTNSIPSMGTKSDTDLGLTSDAFWAIHNLKSGESSSVVSEYLKPFLGSKNEIICAAAACLLFNDRSEIKKYVSKERLP